MKTRLESESSIAKHWRTHVYSFLNVQSFLSCVCLALYGGLADAAFMKVAFGAKRYISVDGL